MFLQEKLRSIQFALESTVSIMIVIRTNQAKKYKGNSTNVSKRELGGRIMKAIKWTHLPLVLLSSAMHRSIFPKRKTMNGIRYHSSIHNLF